MNFSPWWFYQGRNTYVVTNKAGEKIQRISIHASKKQVNPPPMFLKSMIDVWNVDGACGIQTLGIRMKKNV